MTALRRSQAEFVGMMAMFAVAATNGGGNNCHPIDFKCCCNVDDDDDDGRRGRRRRDAKFMEQFGPDNVVPARRGLLPGVFSVSNNPDYD